MKPCIVCGEGNAKSLYPDQGIVECAECHFVYADLGINPREIYTADYFQGGVYPDYANEKRASQKNFKRRLKTIRRYHPRAKCLFEIGCAYGYFLELAQQEYTARGIDISEDAVKVARESVGVDATSGDFLDLPDPRSPDIDVLCMWDVIEHLERPDLHIAKAHRWLKPGGLVALSTVDISSRVARMRGAKWRLLCPPYHLHYFSPQTLGRLVKRAGFEVVHISHRGVARTYKSAVEMAVSNRFLRSLLTLGGVLDFCFTLNTFDLLFAVARKTDS